MQQRKIIIFIVLLFIASSFWLFRASDKFIDPDRGKNWWTVYFSDPNSDNLDFIIENHSNRNYFHWTILENNKKIKEENIDIEKGASGEINLENEFDSGKIVIQVNSGEEKRIIYKNY